MSSNLITYEQAVQWMRSQPEYSEHVTLCYLDQDNLTAAQRFSLSEEFTAVKDVLELDRTQLKLKILDLGCGNGIAAYAFSSLGHEVYAVDPDTSADVGIAATARLADAVKGSLSTFQAFAESLPFPDATFDIVYTRQAVHHFSDLLTGLTECARVLKPKGRLLATREHVVDDEQQLQVFLENHPVHKFSGGENAYPIEKYIATFEQSNLKVIKCLAPFDTVINHYPKSNAQLSSELFEVITHKFGKVAASVMTKLDFVETYYRHRLSVDCNFPGRLYSFLCTKNS